MDKRVDEMAASYGLKRMKGESTSDLCDRISDRHDADKIEDALKDFCEPLPDPAYM